MVCSINCENPALRDFCSLRTMLNCKVVTTIDMIIVDIDMQNYAGFRIWYNFTENGGDINDNI